MRETADRILVIVPCLNEAGSIGAVLGEIEACGPDCVPLVIDDGSTDETFRIASARSLTVRLLTNLGIGGTVHVGIKYAAAHRYGTCVQIDGDGQHPPAEIAKLIEKQRKTGANIVVGSRYLHGDTYRSNSLRRAGSLVIGRLLGLLFGVRAFTDPTSGLRLMDRRAIELFAGSYPHDFPEPISLAIALRAGLTVAECPVQMRARLHGESSLSGLRTLAYMVRVIGYILLARCRT